MSSKKAMKLAQKQAFAKHRSNITNSKFGSKKINLINKLNKKNTVNKKQIVNDKTNASTINIKKASISFKNVYFSYHTNDSFFSDFNLSIKNGERVGIVGRSGAGKSSLVNLLLRFYELDKGEILIDNKNTPQKRKI